MPQTHLRETRWRRHAQIYCDGMFESNTLYISVFDTVTDTFPPLFEVKQIVHRVFAGQARLGWP
jgi:hypothetical protein